MSNMTSKLMNGEEEGIWGDAGYVGAEKREDVPNTNKKDKRIRFHINRRKSSSKNKPKRSQGQIQRREREKSSVRSEVEHVFVLVKKKLRYRKTRYRGLEKQKAKVNMMFALANLIITYWRRAVAAWFSAFNNWRKRERNTTFEKLTRQRGRIHVLCGVAIIELNITLYQYRSIMGSLCDVKKKQKNEYKAKKAKMYNGERTRNKGYNVRTAKL